MPRLPSCRQEAGLENHSEVQVVAVSQVGVGVVSGWGGISVSYSFPPVKLKESTVIEKFQEISNSTH